MFILSYLFYDHSAKHLMTCCSYLCCHLCDEFQLFVTAFHHLFSKKKFFTGYFHLNVLVHLYTSIIFRMQPVCLCSFFSCILHPDSSHTYFFFQFICALVFMHTNIHSTETVHLVSFQHSHISAISVQVLQPCNIE